MLNTAAVSRITFPPTQSLMASWDRWCETTDEHDDNLRPGLSHTFAPPLLGFRIHSVRAALPWGCSRRSDASIVCFAAASSAIAGSILAEHWPDSPPSALHTRTRDSF
ncbi:hypothetical protein HPB47_009083 [Ixodes persulcatus]|uniref:Uncharacterized protein n=1 Tax=Ixodes persulcatus TaxID=34615 RepID=A0AC60P322_IXOPE|nr:hypothetical protein HPB47_009083 [Ixodes persulcatus]